LGVGGCLIHSFHEEPAGSRFTLDIELPIEGWVQVEARSLYVREGYGFAVQFVEMDEATRDRLERVIAQRGGVSRRHSDQRFSISERRCSRPIRETRRVSSICKTDRPGTRVARLPILLAAERAKFAEHYVATLSGTSPTRPRTPSAPGQNAGHLAYQLLQHPEVQAAVTCPENAADQTGFEGKVTETRDSPPLSTSRGEMGFEPQAS